MRKIIADRDYFFERKELAAFIGVELCTLHRMMRRGEIPKGFKQGRKRLWSKARVMKFFDRQDEASENEFLHNRERLNRLQNNRGV